MLPAVFGAAAEAMVLRRRGGGVRWGKLVVFGDAERSRRTSSTTSFSGLSTVSMTTADDGNVAVAGPKLAASRPDLTLPLDLVAL